MLELPIIIFSLINEHINNNVQLKTETIIHLFTTKTSSKT